MTVSCIIYDLDGTLIDSAADITIAVNRVRDHFALEPLEEFEIRNFIGDGAGKLIERSVFGIVENPVERPRQRLPRTATDVEEILELFRGFYSEDPVIETTITKGVESTLRSWQERGIAQVCLTNKPHEIALSVLERLGLLGYFDVVVGRGALDDDGNTLPPKPNPEVIDYILDQTGTEKDETFMVGDGLPDLQVSKASGIECIALLSGYGEPQKLLAEAGNLDLVATSFQAAAELLESL